MYEAGGSQHFSHVVSQGPIRVSVDHSNKNISDEDEELIIGKFSSYFLKNNTLF